MHELAKHTVFGISLVVTLQRIIRLPNLRVSTILLCLAFIYAIFWVFISSLFFTDSLMYVFCALLTNQQSSPGDG